MTKVKIFSSKWLSSYTGDGQWHNVMTLVKFVQLVLLVEYACEIWVSIPYVSKVITKVTVISVQERYFWYKCNSQFQGQEVISLVPL